MQSRPKGESKTKVNIRNKKKTRKEGIKWKDKVGEVLYNHKIVRIAYGETC